MLAATDRGCDRKTARLRRTAIATGQASIAKASIFDLLLLVRNERNYIVQTVNLSTLQAVRVLSSRVHLLSVASTVDQMEDWVNARNGRCRRVTVSGFHGLLLADRDHKLHGVLNGAELWAPDGIAPVLVARLCGHRNVHRTTGTDLMLEFFRRANQREYTSYFYGDTDATLTALSNRVRQD